MTDLRSTDPHNDKARIQQIKGGLLHDSYIWITRKHEYIHWHWNEENQLLWINGHPGKGKTMLMCGIIDELSPSTRLNDQAASTLLSFFFCQATTNVSTMPPLFYAVRFICWSTNNLV
jgi:hypothetical protein